MTYYVKGERSSVELNEEVKILLKAYLEDLEYQGREGFESLNYVSSGTPVFENDDSMNDYIEHVRSIYNKLID